MMAVERQKPARRLSDLLGALPLAGPDPLVYGLTPDSRRVNPGWVFAACRGRRQHGLAYLPAALDAGASAVLWEPADSVDTAASEAGCRAHGVPLVAVPGLSHQLGTIASRLHGDPSGCLRVVGVTGTDGKTSVTQFLAQAVASEGIGCGVIGTLGYGLYGELSSGNHTTPDAALVQELLGGFRDAGAGFVSMEVSSHALDQQRVSGVRFDTAVLTNLGRDHIDYHRSERAYAEAKSRLFTSAGLRCAVVNLDDGFGCAVRRLVPRTVELLGYSLQPDSDADISVLSLRPGADALALEIVTPVGLLNVSVPVIGRFNAQNLLAVAAALVGVGWDVSRISRALAAIRPVPGRMECFGGGDQPLVVVDYAHTAGALEAALRALGEHVPGSIWCVFGCGGDRDRGKRPLMAAAAEARAHHVILADDNPRGEDPERIIQDIQAGFRRRPATVERDRVSAIDLAIRNAGPGDAVLVAGKGDEDYQITAAGIRHYSDRETVAALMAEAQS